nr:uncharacterized protein LOC109785388 [Aegilops tauschii subsp. strangulata]XP_040245518.1 uncharacterized protein LOC109785388 [Aegilops tauschii subsp. strangulata]
MSSVLRKMSNAPLLPRPPEPPRRRAPEASTSVTVLCLSTGSFTIRSTSEFISAPASTRTTQAPSALAAASTTTTSSLPTRASRGVGDAKVFCRLKALRCWRRACTS